MKKNILVIGSVLLVGALLSGGWYIMDHKNTHTTKPVIVPEKRDAPVQTSQQASDQNKPAEDIPASPSLSVTQIDESQANGSVHASAIVLGSKDNAGTCVFTFENDAAKPVVQQVNASIKGSDLVCDSGNISEVQFSFIGSWKLTVGYFNNGVKATGTTNVVIH